MARSLALFFAALIAVSQAAPRPQGGNNTSSSSASAPSSSPNTGASGSAPSTSSNSGSSGTGSGASGTSTGTADTAGTITITIPSFLLSSFFPSASGSSSNGGSASGSSSSGLSASGSSSNGGTASGSSSNGGSASFNDPLTAIISIIPNAINQERNRIQTAVTGLVKDNVDAITDSINTAASTGGRVLSNGVKLVGAWPNFFGQLIG